MKKLTVAKWLLSLLVVATAALSVPTVSQAGGSSKPKTIQEFKAFKCKVYKKPKKKKKPNVNEAPGWVKQEKTFRPCKSPVNEDGKTFAKRVIIVFYDLNSMNAEELKDTGPTSDFNIIKKWGDRNFE